MTMAAPCCQAGEPIIFCTVVWTKLSPCAMSPLEEGQLEPPCISLHTSGVIQTKFGMFADCISWSNCVNGTICCMRAGLLRMLEKYIKGLCFSAYGPADAPVKPGVGRDCI